MTFLALGSCVRGCCSILAVVRLGRLRFKAAAARAISRRTRFEGEASADEACSPGSGAVQVSGRWNRAIWCPTTRPVRKTYKSG